MSECAEWVETLWGFTKYRTDPIFGTNILCKINPTNPGCGGGGGKKGNGGGNGGENGGDNGGGGKY